MTYLEELKEIRITTDFISCCNSDKHEKKEKAFMKKSN